MSRRSSFSAGRHALLLAAILSLSSLAQAPSLALAAEEPTAVQPSVSEQAAARGLKAKLVSAAGRAARSFGGRVDRVGDWLDGKGAAMSARQSHSRLGRTVSGSGRALKLLFGSETLLNTSFEIGGGVSIASPLLTRFINTNAGAALWTGSVAFHEKGIKDVMVDRWVSMDCPLAGVGYSKLGKLGVSVSGLPLVSGYKSTRSHAIYVGVGGAAEVGIGEVGPGTNDKGEAVPARGPFVEGYLSIPVLPLGFLNAFGGFAFSFYSPALRPITKHMERPAIWLHKQGQKYQAAIAKRTAPVKRLAHKLKGATMAKAHWAQKQLTRLRPRNQLARRSTGPTLPGAP